MKNQKIIIAGGSGFIGSHLAAWFGKDNEVILLTRARNHKNNSYGKALPQSHAVRKLYWDGKTAGEWVKALDGASLLINLAGKSVNCRYTAKNRQEIFDSRTQPTEILGQAVRVVEHPPKLWINVSSATIYRHADDKPQDEFTGEYHHDFSVQVCKKWEQTFFKQETPDTRKIALRMAITLGNGGVLVPYKRLVKFGLGGHQGSGGQMFSWVHADDVCRTIEQCWNHIEMEGIYNCCSPNPLPNRGFMRALRNAEGVSFGLPSPAWLLKAGAIFIGTEAELILKSRWVVPTRLQQTGFQFKYPVLKDALQNIFSHQVDN